MRPGRGALIAAIAGSLGLFASAPAGALSPPTGWNGANPFNCEVQYAGFGTAFPHPDADPFCVDFDKRRQNITDLGVVDFLAQEPARVAAASPKCFYFQSDHWRGSIVQGDPSTKDVRVGRPLLLRQGDRRRRRVGDELQLQRPDL